MNTPGQSTTGATRAWALRLTLLVSLVLLTACDGLVEIRGRVVDDAGQPVAAAEVRLGRPGESVECEEQTDANGCFYIGGMVSPGVRDYHLKVEASEYEPYAGVFSNRDRTVVLVTLAGAGSGRESSSASSATELEACP